MGTVVELFTRSRLSNSLCLVYYLACQRNSHSALFSLLSLELPLFYALLAGCNIFFPFHFLLEQAFFSNEPNLGWNGTCAHRLATLVLLSTCPFWLHFGWRSSARLLSFSNEKIIGWFIGVSRLVCKCIHYNLYDQL